MSGVGLRGGNGVFQADDAAPWLPVPSAQRHAGGWIRVRYRTGLFDECVRPLIRFQKADGTSRQVAMNGAVLGVAEWTGHVPHGTVSVWISPVRRAGRFSFAIDSVAPVSRLALLRRGLRRDFKLAVMAMGARLIGAREEARYCLKFAALATDMEDYDSWIGARQRPFDLDGFDAPHADWSRTPVLRFVMPAGGDAAASARTQESLRAQSYPHWTLHVLEDGARLADQGFGADDPVALLHPGDRLMPHGGAAIIEAFAASPSALACYGDEDLETGGRLQAPRFKPDWSPIFQAGTCYVGDGVFIRFSALTGLGCATAAGLAGAQRLLTELPPDSVAHVRRLVWRRSAVSPPRAAAPVTDSGEQPRAAIVVPTRDHPELLRDCIDGVLRRTDYPALELILVDNGTVDAQALRLMEEAQKDSRVRVLRAPGPFNYSALCNQGAAASDAPLLVFFNNDVVVTDTAWLRRLAHWAMQPGIGVVGPKLLYPCGKVQHGGDVIGMGETAKQAYRGAADGDGYLGQLGHVREVGGVTGAVQAVAREKFMGSGGFDTEKFPVLFNDTDLCLRLAQQGLVSVFEPAARMVHLESASRGFSMRPFTVHAHDWANIAPRWMPALRDDRYFHPALSLYCCTPSLG